MYNRYVPNSQGSFDRQRAGTPRPIQKPTETPRPIHESSPQAVSQPTAQNPSACSKPAGKCLPQLRLPDRLDTGDLLVLLILLLLLQENDEDPLTLIITLAAFFLFQ